MSEQLKSPDGSITLNIHDCIKLGRFDKTTWKLHYGWYSWSGNRQVCGWYLCNLDCEGNIKPFQITDFDDLLLVTHTSTVTDDSTD